MTADRRISIGGITDKPVHWHCASDPVEAEAVHPVQMVHLHVGAEEDHDGKSFRIIHLDMIGAELMVYREVITPASHGRARHD
ncbi:hypothetical protein [Amycolatopsis taiwanensis]|uniref:Uncharacterized protein n=1 Tax=Amycolatopsis taiwanensis TaxID=342230 RepID=A0A9W6VJR6_9PSEU|nr:hypothetical protein [Amycolatopsis taiwanensis]GLY70970.1 hypothetical protein Atai01_75890 [Amycolatopsis taiwanensis]